MNVNHPEYWDQIYRNERPRWDLGAATPVFEQWLKFRNRMGAGTIAVLGCGNGHDSILFAEHGFNVTAIDFAAEPLVFLKENIPAHLKNIHLLKEDIFELPKTHIEYFDFVLEYTCYCAIDPIRRNEYVEAVYCILKPQGHLIGLFFPTDGRPGGPPFAIRYEEIEEKFLKKFNVVIDEVPLDSVPKRKGMERFVILQKK